MKSKDALIALYHASQLKNDEQAQLEDMIASGEITLEELSLNKEVLDQLADAEDLADTQNMDDRFFTFLEKESQQNESPKILPFFAAHYQTAVAAVILTLFAFWGGLSVGSWDSKEQPEDTHQAFLQTMLNTEDVSERIHVISTHQLEEKLDKKVLDALLFSLNNDESSNVRLACIEVLRKYSREDPVRESLIRAISQQHSTLVLIEIAEAISQSGEKISTQEFFTYVREDMHPVLQASLKEALLQR